ncbi:MAG: hypothetical protein LBL76_06710, partial [Treponema sp.]|nr:hypothetical protein [Treponema sp.]
MKRIAYCLILLLCGVSCASQKPQKSALIADVDPILLGLVGIAFDPLFSSTLDTKDVSVSFNPRDNTVSLEFRYQTVIYRQYWDQAGRDQFIAAVQRYHTDFEARNLSTKASKSRTAYGT